MTTFQEKYTKEATPTLRARFGYKNIMAVPRIEKAVINVGIGRMREEKDRSEVEKYITMITGQKPSPRPAKKAIAAFKTRQGLIVGYQVTLRGRRMRDFLSRLVSAALPRTRDFRGLDEKSFDRRGNLTIGVREHIVFPEMIGEDYRVLFGMEVTVVTTAKKREEGMELLRLMGFPIKSSE
jgi:large subunit ribosomal protein L5